MGDWPAGMNIRGAWAAGGYAKGDVVTRDGVAWLCTNPTTDPPGSLFPPFRTDLWTVASRGRFTSRIGLQLTDSTSQHGSAQAVNARAMQAFDFRAGLVIPGADEFYINLFDSADGSLVADDYNFSANNGVSFVFSAFSGSNSWRILKRTSHGAGATTVASTTHGIDKTIANYRVTCVANGSNWDIAMYDFATSVLTTTALTIPASVIPAFGAWCGGTGGNWSVFPQGDYSTSTNWASIGAADVFPA